MRIIDAREQHARRLIPRCPTCGHEIASAVIPRLETARRGACGHPMKTGQPCARAAGHGQAHRSRYVMDAEALRRRKSA